jgi:hypothetical protein
LVEPGGTGYPPPATGLLATTFVPTRFHVVEAEPVLAKTMSTANAKRSLFMPLLSRVVTASKTGRLWQTEDPLAENRS